jgi:hypothetical protein
LDLWKFVPFFSVQLRIKMVEAAGIEPAAKNSEVVNSQVYSQIEKLDYAQIRAQILDELGPELTHLVSVWSKLSAALKAAILAIVKSVEGGR